jgi:hypothetical protein
MTEFLDDAHHLKSPTADVIMQQHHNATMVTPTMSRHFIVGWCLLAFGLLTPFIGTQFEQSIPHVADVAVGRARKRRRRRQVLIGALPAAPFDMSRYTCIFFYHTRKAGGTAMREWLKQVADKHNLTFVAKEGHLLQDDDLQDDDALHVTILRDPVDRAISSYWFEGRWPQAEQNRTDENSPLDLFNWTSQVNQQTRGKNLWQCASDCYCKWFGSSMNDGGIHVDYNRNVTNALERLARFDVVVQMERLTDNNYTSALQMVLNATELSVVPRNMGGLSHAHSNYTITKSHRDYLAEMNRNDKALYETVFGKHAAFAVSLATHSC